MSAIQPRTYPIGDIHGCYKELAILIEAINPQKYDTLIFLGDYIDRGEYSQEVIDTIISLKDRCNVIALLGNHEAMMINALTEEDDYERFNSTRKWLQNGGDKTAESYYLDIGALLAAQELEDIQIPNKLQSHLDFLRSLPLYHITDTHIFVHASVKLDEAIEHQQAALLWRKANKKDAEHDYTHISGKTIVCGHTAQWTGVPCKLSEKNILIDTGCFSSGWLTAMNIDNGSYIQASTSGVRILNSSLSIIKDIN